MIDKLVRCMGTVAHRSQEYHDPLASMSVGQGFDPWVGDTTNAARRGEAGLALPHLPLTRYHAPSDKTQTQAEHFFHQCLL